MFHKINNILYHGTVSEILRIDVSAGRGRKDFGKGFYMSVTKRQAIGMMHKKYRETVRRNPSNTDYKEYLYEIHLNENIIDSQYFIGKQEVADTLIKEMILIDWR